MSIWQVISIILVLLLAAAFLVISTLNRQAQRLSNDIEQLKADVASTMEQANRKIQDMSNAFENEKRELEARHAAEMSEEHLRYERELQRQRERIESRRDVLSQMDDKSLLVDMMLALEGYGGRLDRLESGLDASNINDRIREVSDEVSSMVSNMSSYLEEQIDNLKTSIAQSMNSIDVSQLMDKLDGISLNVDDTNDVVNDMSDTIDSIKRSVIDEYDYDSLLDVAKEAQSDAYDAKTAAEEARDAAQEARDAAQEAKYAAQEAKDSADNAEYAISSHF